MVPTMSYDEVIYLSSEEETEVTEVEDIKPTFQVNSYGELSAHNITEVFEDRTGAVSTVPQHMYKDSNLVDNKVTSFSALNFCQREFNGNGNLSSDISSRPSDELCRQFWKAGDYGSRHGPQTTLLDGRNHLRVHPKFLHSNATSHKWVFGAVAELLDNAVDEIKNGATFAIVDVVSDMQTQNPALLIQDDGGGMDPESLRRCMSFGFSDKDSGSSIGQYGNGFKTSTMRLGADVMVFSRAVSNDGNLVQSIGLLSYTFLRLTGADDIVVPMVDYEVNMSSGLLRRLSRHGESHFSYNLNAILKWSLFGTEDDLLKQFDDIGPHGTKIFVFNLWLNDDGVLELDFDSEEKDIMISGAPKVLESGKNSARMLAQNHIATRLRFSLRAYLSILYLHLPQHFRIMLRGQEVQPHKLVNDLRYVECIKYTPNITGNKEAVFITTIGFLDGAPNLNLHGFSLYHKNRLILPFWRVISCTSSRGRGVAGVLEANFIKPTHDKQDFEKSMLFIRLETRLKEMTLEYWDYHCHLVGYPNKKLNIPGFARAPTSDLSAANSAVHAAFSGLPHQNFCTGVGMPVRSALHGQMSTGLPHKRRHADQTVFSGTGRKQAPFATYAEKTCTPQGQGVRAVRQNRRDVMLMMQENKGLQSACLELERAEKELELKAENLRRQLEAAKGSYEQLVAELRTLS